jgi:hypothetical protein
MKYRIQKWGENESRMNLVYVTETGDDFPGRNVVEQEVALD